MRAALLRAISEPLTIEDVELAAPKSGEVRVRVDAAGVCHSDLHYMTGDLQGHLPLVPGHEGTGIVIEAGQNVTEVAVGDRVVFTWRPRCGACRFCIGGRPHLCVLGRVQGTTGGLTDGTTRLRDAAGGIHHLMGVSCFAEECVVSAKSVVRIGRDVPDEIAAIVGCAVVTGVGAALNVVRAGAGAPVLVIGAGGVGLSAVMGLRLIGAGPIIVSDTVPARLDRAREIGADVVVDVTRESLEDALAQAAPEGVAWALDAVGSPATLEQGYGTLAVGGTLVAVGLSSAGAEFSVPINLLVQQERRVVGSLYGSSNPVEQVPRILELAKAGRLPLDRLVGARFELDDVNAAFQAMRDGAVGRGILVP